MRARFAIGAIIGAVLCACRGGAEDPSHAEAELDLPGIDTKDFTPRERHELSRYVSELPAPCRSIAASLRQCVVEKRPCASCSTAAMVVAKAVREGMSHEQVLDIYKQRFDDASAKSIPVDGSPSRGPESAPVTLVEFADFECPFCQHIAPELDQLFDAKRDRLRFVFKFMPLAMHPRGEPAARAAIAAQAQGKFWEMHHQLFANGGHLEDSDLDMYAKAIGLDLPRFHTDLHSAATDERLKADRKLADDLGVKGTPSLFINGHSYDGKADIYEWVDAEVRARQEASGK
jgi:protein-disulfide isomerase